MTSCDNAMGKAVTYSQALAAYKRRQIKATWAIGLLAMALLAACLISLSSGMAPFGWRELYLTLLQGPNRPEDNMLAHAVIWHLRLPRVVLAALAGAALGLAGAATQAALRNPLASPFTLGIASAAGFGAAAAISLSAAMGLGEWFIAICAFVSSLSAVGIVLLISRLRAMRAETIILVGVGIMYLFSAMTAAIQYFSESEKVAAIVFWLLGSLEAATWHKAAICGGTLAIIAPFLYTLAWDFNALLEGDESACGLGVAPGRVRWMALCAAAMVVSSAICFVGTIGFIGLVSPHISRLWVGVDHRFQMPAATLVGAMLLVLADWASRALIPPHVLPTGIMTSCVGVPFFFYFILRRHRESEI